MIKQIAIYGGAFDPPHLGHLGLIKHLINLPGMDEVWVLPCGDREDKKLLMRKEQRFQLMRKLFEGDQRIRVSEEEIELSKALGKAIHTYDLLKELRKKYQARFHFVVGADILQTIHLWGSAEKLIAETDFLVFHRKGYQFAHDKLPPNNKVVQVDLPEVSSSQLKGIIGSKSSIDDKKEQLKIWIDPITLDYLGEHGFL